MHSCVNRDARADDIKKLTSRARARRGVINLREIPPYSARPSRFPRNPIALVSLQAPPVREPNRGFNPDVGFLVSRVGITKHLIKPVIAAYETFSFNAISFYNFGYN